MIPQKEIAMEETAARRAAEALLAEHKANTRFKALAGLASMADAYDIQDKYVPLLRAAHGAAVGYKVGLTSKAMQTFCGIDHPIAGVCWQAACISPAPACAVPIMGGSASNSRSRCA